MAAAIPTIKSALDCTDFGKTVSPYLHQLSASHVLPLLRHEIAPLEWYLSTNPLVTSILFSVALSVVVFVFAEFNRNFSQVDRLWSFLPTIYIIHFAVFARMAGIDTQRIDTLATFAILWSCRLTYNYWRKGGYNIGSEDYRWEIVKAKIPLWAFTLLDLVFIAFIQNLLLCAVSAGPSYILMLFSSLPGNVSMSTVDTIISRTLIVILILETLADQQQWDFQQAKKKYKSTGEIARGFTKEDLERGFVVTGLWAICRHPNFLCEQAIWVTVYQWTCVLSESLYNWSGIGAVAYCLLFQASTVLTEEITAGKYEEYRVYQKLVNKFVPGFGGFGRDTEKIEAKKE